MPIVAARRKRVGVRICRGNVFAKEKLTTGFRNLIAQQIRSLSQRVEMHVMLAAASAVKRAEFFGLGPCKGLIGVGPLRSPRTEAFDQGLHCLVSSFSLAVR